jgi:1-acyl-sn-glycerol-3-phosphate acyltransferase
MSVVTEERAPSRAKAYPVQIRGWYRVVRGIFGFLIRLFSRFEIEGLENVPDQGPYLLATNHLHWLDAPATMAAFPYRTYVFAGEKWAKHWLLGPLMRSLDAIFVQRGEVDRKALRQAMDVLAGGGILGLAPEGTRSKTGGLQRGRTGAAYMSIRAQVRVLPAVAVGQAELLPSLRRLRRARVRIVFGPALEPPQIRPGEKAGTDQVQAFAEEIMLHLAALLPPTYRGVYRDAAAKRTDLVTRS